MIFPTKNTLHKPFLFFLLVTFSFQVSGQIFPVKKYPAGYFIYPVEAKVGLAEILVSCALYWRKHQLVPCNTNYNLI